MKYFNQYLFAILTFALLTTSCGKDEDPEPAQSLSLAEIQAVLPGTNFKPVEPANLYNSGSPYAYMVSTFATYSTMYPSLMAGFVPPADAQISHTPISTANGRIAGNQVLVYEWAYADGSKIAYQVMETSDAYRWDLFIQLPEHSNYIHFIRSEQNKLGTEGRYIIYSSYEEEYPEDVYPIVDGTWSWNSNAQDYAYTMNLFSGAATPPEMKIAGQLKGDGSGYMNWEEFSDNSRMEMQWNANGSGSWQEFVNGVLQGQGSW